MKLSFLPSNIEWIVYYKHTHKLSKIQFVEFSQLNLIVSICFHQIHSALPKETIRSNQSKQNIVTNN